MSVVLQNVIFPTNLDPDVLSLYVDSSTWTSVHGSPVRLSQPADLTNIETRYSSKLEKNNRTSFATYFNAFPASYWQHWTVVREVTLELNLTGTGTVLVYRSNANGQQQRMEVQNVKGENVTCKFKLPLNRFGDGGWYWFDIIAGEDDLTLNRGYWTTDAKPVKTGKLSLGMCTYNKAEYCVQTLANIAGEPALTAEIDQILLVDQGTVKVEERPEFPKLQKQLGKQLRVINQGNLGGSGGYSRAMAETLKLDDSDYLLLIDDDIEFEPESALRALQFGRFCKKPTIVGGHMFDLFDKPVLHAWTEVVREPVFLWGPAFPEQSRHDFRISGLRTTTWMHARHDAQYNGWWMCMIPKDVIKEIGLSLPIFIKWDDSEYALRAAEHGFKTVSMPGVALWHMSWIDKDDSIDWQAYFHTRNRIIAGLLHSKSPRGGLLPRNVGRVAYKNLLNMQYYATQLMVNGMRDALKGPQALKGTVGTVMPAARAIAKDFPETKIWTPADADAPESENGRADVDNSKFAHYHRIARTQNPIHFGARTIIASVKTLLKKDGAETKPELEYPKPEAFWWRLPNHSSVLVGSADGSGKMHYQFNKKHHLRLWKESQLLSRQLRRDWNKLSAAYKKALPEITSPEYWEEIFKNNP